MLHFALRRTLCGGFGCTVQLVQQRLLGHHVDHHKADAAFITAHTGQACKQKAAAEIVDNGMSRGGSELVLVEKIQKAMHVFALVVDLFHNKSLGLYAVNPFRRFAKAVAGALSRGSIDGHHPVASGRAKPRSCGRC